MPIKGDKRLVVLNLKYSAVIECLGANRNGNSVFKYDIYRNDEGCGFVFVSKMSGRMQAYDFDDVISEIFWNRLDYKCKV